MVPDFSAIHCPRQSTALSSTKTTLVDWTVEQDPNKTQQHSGSRIDFQSGQYLIPLDGLYSIIVQLIPLNGANTFSSARRRQRVSYAIQISKPPTHTTADDAVVSDYHDVGSLNFAQVVHLAAGSRIACIMLPDTVPRECIRLKVQLIYKKRKRPDDEDLADEDQRKRGHSADSASEDDSSSASEDLNESKEGDGCNVERFSKRFRSSPAE